MKSFWVVVAVITIVATIVTGQDQGQGSPGSQMQAESGWPNQADEPLNRKTRQFWGGVDSMAFACGILCPDDEIDLIPYRAPRPTKGKFIPIHG